MSTLANDPNSAQAAIEVKVRAPVMSGPSRPEPSQADQALLPSQEAIQEEIGRVMARELSADFNRWAEAYARVGRRNVYLWKWASRGVEVTTLPCVPPEVRQELYDTKVLGVMFDCLLDDVADQQGDAVLLEHLLELPYGRPETGPSRLSPDGQAYAQVTAEVWGEIQRRVRRYPCFDEYADLLRFDYLQLLNAMRYSYLLNRIPALLNLAEHDLYTPHNMHMMVSATIDLMCSPAFDRMELGLVREAVWHAQCMGRIGNLITTWQRELKEEDFSSGVYARAVSEGDLAVGDLLAGDSRRIERAILDGNHETYFLRRRQEHRRHLAAIKKKVRSVDLEELIVGLDRLICLHLGSRGYK